MFPDIADGSAQARALTLPEEEKQRFGYAKDGGRIGYRMGSPTPYNGTNSRTSKRQTG